MSAGWIKPSVFRELETGGTTAYRLYGLGESAVERFGESALVSAVSAVEIEWLSAELRGVASGFGWECRRVFGRRLVRTPGEADKPVLVWGDGGDSREVVLESGLRYEVDLAASYSPGLFCDQRANREFLQGRRPGHVLNLFSYTCAFSVAAASVGAWTTSVDVSKAALERGKRNFAGNGIDLAGHRFVVDDAGEYLRRLVRRGDLFDAMIIDPPTFGRASGRKTFQIARDLPGLIRMAAEVCQPGAAILVSTNFRGWDAVDLESLVRAGLPNGTAIHRVDRQPDFAPGSGSVTLWALL